MNAQSSTHPPNEIASLLFAIDPDVTLPLQRANGDPATIDDLKSAAQLFVPAVNANGHTCFVFTVEDGCQADDYVCEIMPTAALFNAGMLILVFALSHPVAASAVKAVAESLGAACRQQSAPIFQFDSESCSGLIFDVGKDVGLGLFGHTHIPMPSADWALVYLNAAQVFALDDLPRIYGNSAYGARTYSLDELARVDGIVGA